METITLRAGPLGVVLVPEAGGALGRFWSEAAGAPVELLRPAPPEAVARGDPWSMASFPLVPWSNRIRRGRFVFGGRAVALDLPPGPHALHGLGFRSAWTVVERTAALAHLEHRYGGGAWPWAYRAAQRVALTPAGLTLELAVTNAGDAAMPVGLGWHPYFPRTRETSLVARVAAVWLTDAEVMPVALAALPPAWEPSAGLRVDQVALDNVLVGWDGVAEIAWPERRARLRLVAESLGCLVVYTPPGRSFFCAEPVSHVTDAFNLAAAGRPDTGLRVVAPGETARVALTLTPELR